MPWWNLLWRSACRMRSLRYPVVSIWVITVEICKSTHDDEEDGQDDETHQLDGFTTPGIDEQESSPVSWNQAGSGKNQISLANVVQVIVDSSNTLCDGGSETDCLENDSGVETKTIEGDL